LYPINVVPILIFDWLVINNSLNRYKFSCVDVVKNYCKYTYTFFVRCEQNQILQKLSYVSIINDVESRTVVFMVNIHEIIIPWVSTIIHRLPRALIPFSFLQIPICFLTIILLLLLQYYNGILLVLVWF